MQCIGGSLSACQPCCSGSLVVQPASYHFDFPAASAVSPHAWCGLSVSIWIVLNTLSSADGKLPTTAAQVCAVLLLLPGRLFKHTQTPKPDQCYLACVVLIRIVIVGLHAAFSVECCVGCHGPLHAWAVEASLKAVYSMPGRDGTISLHRRALPCAGNYNALIQLA